MTGITREQFAFYFGPNMGKLNGGSYATKCGFAIGRSTGHYVVQDVTTFVAGQTARPPKTDRAIQIQIGNSGELRDWGALARFLQDYARFVELMARFIRNNDKSLETKFATSYLIDFVRGQPKTLDPAVKNPIYYLEDWVSVPENFATLTSKSQLARRTKAAIGDEWVGDWDDEEGADVDHTVDATAAAPPLLADTDWTDDWE